MIGPMDTPPEYLARASIQLRRWREVPAKLGYSPIGTGAARFALAAGDSGTIQVWRITR
jgi:hypothetical protein